MKVTCLVLISLLLFSLSCSKKETEFSKICSVYIFTSENRISVSVFAANDDDSQINSINIKLNDFIIPLTHQQEGWHSENLDGTITPGTTYLLDCEVNGSHHTGNVSILSPLSANWPTQWNNSIPQLVTWNMAVNSQSQEFSGHYEVNGDYKQKSVRLSGSARDYTIPANWYNQNTYSSFYYAIYAQNEYQFDRIYVCCETGDRAIIY